MALSFDGHVIGGPGDFGGTSANSFSLTTTQLMDVIVVVVSCEVTTAPHATVLSVTATGLTFTKRSSVYQDNSSGTYGTTWNTLEVWSAPAALPLTAALITVTVSSTIDCGMIGAFGVNFDGISLPVWSANASLPNTTTSATNAAPTLGSNSTNAAALLFGFAASAIDTAQTAGSGFTLIDSNFNPNGAVAIALGEEYKSLGSAASGQTVAFGSTWNTWLMIVDALEAPGGGGGDTLADACSLIFM